MRRREFVRGSRLDALDRLLRGERRTLRERIADWLARMVGLW